MVDLLKIFVSSGSIQNTLNLTFHWECNDTPSLNVAKSIEGSYTSLSSILRYAYEE